MGSFRNLGISRKLQLFLAVAVAGFILSSVISLFTLKQNLYSDRQIKTRHIVETAYGVLEHFHALAQQGRLTDADAQAQAIAVIGALRYDGKEYLWINDMQPRMVMHPYKPEMNGQDLSNFKDPNGKRLFVEFVKVVRDGKAGFVEYLWPKPGIQEPVPKISYVKGFEPWGWVIGSGIYIDDVDAVFRQESLKFSLIALSILGVLAFVSWHIARSITSPLNELQAVMLGIQENHDLSVRALLRGGDEVGQMAAAFNGLVANFQAIVRDIAAHSRQVADTAKTVSQSAMQVKQSSHSQNDSMSSSAAAIEEVTESISSVADNAVEVLGYSKESLERSRHGNESLAQLVGAIDQAESSVEEIAGSVHAFVQDTQEITLLTKQVRDIADQTNLLALNAAIEAARAGEQGRGFAVVADEVRKLAEKSANAASQIDTVTLSIEQQSRLVETTLEKGKQSLQFSQNFMENVAEVLASASMSVASTNEGIDTITHSVKEQNVAMANIAGNVEHVVQMAEENEVAVNRISDAAGDLERLACRLEKRVGRFGGIGEAAQVAAPGRDDGITLF